MCSPSRRPRLALALGGLTLLAGCATTPPLPPAGAAAWLGGQPRVVARLDAGQVKAWGAVTRSSEALRAVGDRTRTVWLGFDIDSLDDLKTAAGSVRVVLEGDFPKNLVGLALDWNSAWTKGPAPGVWTNKKLGLSVSLPAEGLVAVRRNDPAPAEPGTGILRDLNPVPLAGAAAWVTFWEPGRAIFGDVGAQLLPIGRVDVVLAAEGTALEGPVTLRFADDRAPKAASVLMKLFGPQIRARLGQDLDWTAEGPNLVGRTLRLNQSDLETLARSLLAEPPTPEAQP